MAITKEQIKDLNDALKPLAEQAAAARGMTLVATKGTFGEIVKLTFEFAPVRDGVVETKERVFFLKYAASYGLKPEHIDQSITVNGGEYVISGMTRGGKVQITRDGKHYTCTTQFVARQLGVL